MGFLRKIAGLVVEFPDQPQPGAQPKGNTKDADDVLAAIEKARQDLEGSLNTDFDKTAAKPAATTASKPAASTGGAPTDKPVQIESSAGITLPGVLSISEVYERAKIAPDPNGFDVYKVEAMLKDPEMADLAMDIRARMVKMTLKSMNRELHEVLLDAARRDQALEQYGQWLSGKVDEVSAQVEAQNSKLQQEMEQFIAAHNSAMEQNKRALSQARGALSDFQDRKHAEEERLFNTVAPFVAPGENPVIIDRPGPLGDRPAPAATPLNADKQEKRK